MRHISRRFEHVTNIARTPPRGRVDAVVTEYGVTVNPRRADLLDACASLADVPPIGMDELADRAAAMSGPMDPVETADRVVGVVEWRDGAVIDVVRRLARA